MIIIIIIIVFEKSLSAWLIAFITKYYQVLRIIKYCHGITRFLFDNP